MAVLMLGIVANAQGHRGSWQDRPQRERPDEATMIQERTDRMAEKYGLDEAQKAKLLELNKTYSLRIGRPDDRRDTTKFRKEGIHNQTQINLYLVDCVKSKKGSRVHHQIYPLCDGGYQG